MAQADRLTGLVGDAAIKVPCRAASTGNLTLTGEQTLDGVACVTDDRVLVKNQTDPIENGIYVVDTGDWNRAPDFDGPHDVVEGTLVYVTDGTVAAGLFYVQTTAEPVIGTDSLAFSVVSPSSPITVPHPLTQGGTGADNAISALANLGVIQVTAEGGTANVQTGTIDALVTAYRADQVFLYVPAVTNTGAVTLGLTPSGGAALGAKNVFANGAACVGGELVANTPVLLHYDGIQLNIIGQPQNTVPYVSARGAGLINGNIEITDNSSALLVRVIHRSGTAVLSTSTPVYAWIRAATAAGITPTLAKLVAATSLTLPAGAELGVVANQPFRVWTVLFDDAGTYRLGVIKTLVGTPPNHSIYPLGAWGIASSQAAGTGSDSAGVFYTDSAVTDKPYVVLGYATWESGLPTPGTWTTPTRRQQFDAGVPLPGRPTGNCVREQTGAVATGTDVTIQDDSIPQLTEGDEYLDVSITPSSAANLLRHRGHWQGASSAGLLFIMHLHVDATADAFAAVTFRSDVVDQCVQGRVEGVTQAAGTVAQVTNLLVGGTVAGTRTFNGAAGARLLGGVMASFLEVEEIMT